MLPYVQDGVLKDSTYKLEAVQSVQYIDVTRYELLYHIINSYEGSYIPKRAIVDYDVKTNKPWMVDWREVTWEGNYSKVERNKLDSSKNIKIVESFPELYPEIKEDNFYTVFQDDINKYDQYKVVFRNKATHEKDIQIFYRMNNRVVMLVKEKKAMEGCKSYRKKYENMTAITNAARNCQQLSGAVIYAKALDIFKNGELEKVVEWAKNCKLINYRFHG